MNYQIYNMYKVRWSGKTNIYSVKLPEKSTVQDVLFSLSNKLKLTEEEFDTLSIRGSLRPHNEYTLNQLAPVDDILVIFTVEIGGMNPT